MGLRGTAGTSYLGSRHADLHAAECTTEDALAEGLLPAGEFGLHQETEQLEVARAPILLQETQQKHERMGRPVEILVQTR